jgi:SAM-dependent methyltransferase
MPSFILRRALARRAAAYNLRMRRHPAVVPLALAAALIALQCAPAQVSTAGAQAPARKPDVPYEPTPPEVVEVMLSLAELRPGDLVYDLGCGDGRIVIAAVQKAGVRGVCVDIDPARIAESRRNAAAAGVAERITFRTEDLFRTRFDDATVVMLFLWPEINLRLRPRLRQQLRPGTRIVSHWHDMGDWEPDRVITVTGGGRPRPVYLWSLPAHSEAPGSF